MKNLSQLLMLLCLIATQTFSQSSNLILVKAGEDPVKVIPKKLVYRFDNFQNGKLYFASGKSSTPMLLNYNCMFDDLAFIDKKGDTLIVGFDEVFSNAQIGAVQFYHHLENGYFEILQGNDKVKLLSKSHFEIQRKDATGNNGYGSVSGTTTPINATRVSGIAVVRNYDLSYSKNVSYFLLEGDERFLKATKASFLKLFPDQKDDIKDYLKANEVDFAKEEDLKRITAYCLQLKSK